jgi:hypothetical protein
VRSSLCVLTLLEKKSAQVRSRENAAIPNRQFQFKKRSQLFIGAHNETLSVAAMCVSNEDCSPVGIHG